MKRIIILLTSTTILLAGCIYEAPLTNEHTIAVDSALLGLWEYIPGEGEKLDEDERMMILKFSNTEYLLHYPVSKDGLYYRCYPIKIGGVSCIQIQVIGTSEGAPDDEKELFHVIKHEFANGELNIKTLNTDLVDDGLKTSEALKQAFLKHKGNSELFIDPGNFRRVE